MWPFPLFSPRGFADAAVEAAMIRSLLLPTGSPLGRHRSAGDRAHKRWKRARAAGRR